MPHFGLVPFLAFRFRFSPVRFGFNIWVDFSYVCYWSLCCLVLLGLLGLLGFLGVLGFFLSYFVLFLLA